MLFTKAALVFFSSVTLIAAWDVTSTGEAGSPREHHTSGRGTSQCINRNHRKDDKLKFSRDGSSCCIHLYKEGDCNLSSSNDKGESLCRDVKNKDIDFHFRSYYVDCDNRGINNPTPMQVGEIYTPYNNGPPPYQYNQPPPYGNQPPPYPYNQPPPYNNGPPLPYPPYNPREGPYRPYPGRN